MVFLLGKKQSLLAVRWPKKRYFRAPVCVVGGGGGSWAWRKVWVGRPWRPLQHGLWGNVCGSVGVAAGCQPLEHVPGESCWGCEAWWDSHRLRHTYQEEMGDGELPVGMQVPLDALGRSLALLLALSPNCFSASLYLSSSILWR